MKRRTFLKGLISLPAITIPSISLAKPNTSTSKDLLLYLEVSARRMGKTKRLIEHMNNYISSTGNLVYFTSGSLAMTRYVREEYFNKLAYSEFVIDLIPEVDHAIKYGKKLQNWRIYYDEVDYLDDKYVFINNNAYYVGTPGSKGHLKKLAELNNNNFVQYKWDMEAVQTQEFKQNMSDKYFKSEILAEFV